MDKKSQKEKQAELYAKLDKLVATLPDDRKAVLVDEIDKKSKGI